MNGHNDSNARAQARMKELAKAQVTDAAIAGTLCVDLGWDFMTARKYVAQHREMLVAHRLHEQADVAEKFHGIVTGTMELSGKGSSFRMQAIMDFAKRHLWASAEDVEWLQQVIAEGRLPKDMRSEVAKVGGLKAVNGGKR